MSELPLLFCRFCKELTKQLVSPNNTHHRVCILCWRRQRDGVRVEITDGERVSQRAERGSKPPSIPPPPLLPDEYAYKTDLNDALRLIEQLEARVTHLEQTTDVIGSNSHHHTLYK